MVKEWFNDACELLKKKLSENSEKGYVEGEQFLRDYFLENPPNDYDEDDEDNEDLYISTYLPQFQDYLRQQDWLYVEDGYIWGLSKPNKSVKKIEKKTQVLSPDQEALLELSLQSVSPEQADLIREFMPSLDKTDPKKYRKALLLVATGIEKSTTATNDEKSRLWENAGQAAQQAGAVNAYKWYSNAATYKALQAKYEEAGNLIEKAIVAVDPRLHQDKNGYLERLRERSKFIYQNLTNVELSDEKKQLVLKLIRLCRSYYEQAGISSKASEWFVNENHLLISVKGKIKKGISLLYWLFSQYGESPLRVAVTAMTVILLCAVFYHSQGIHLNISIADDRNSFLTHLYFSVVTFTTLGYGDFSPIGAARVVSSIQALLGLFITSLFLVTFVRKYAR